MRDLNLLLGAVRSRQKSLGITTRAAYLREMSECLGGVCPSNVLARTSETQWRGMLKRARRELAYHLDGMEPLGISRDAKAADGNSLPPHTIANFSAVITTTRQDRDGDILESEGAQLDPKSSLLWQHLPTEPIGKLLPGTGKVDAAKVLGRFAIADTALGQDAALLAEFGALRISHGFLPDDYELLDEDQYEHAGFHILSFKILEVSLVSVPSNPDAELTAFSRQKLKHPLVKALAEHRFRLRTAQVPVVLELARACTCKNGNTEMQTKGAVPFTDAPVSESTTWDAAGAVKRMRKLSGADGDEPTAAEMKAYSKGFALVDGDPENLTSYKLPYRDVEDGKLVIVPKGVSAAIGALNGGRGGGMDISEADRKAAYEVLVKAYKKAYPDQEPPELKSLDQLRAKGIYLEPENSWNDIQEDLNGTVKAYMVTQGVAGPADWVYIATMFSGHAWVCVVEDANYSMGELGGWSYTDDRNSYYDVAWEMGDDGEPAWTGEPKAFVPTIEAGEAVERAFASRRAVILHATGADMKNADGQRDQGFLPVIHGKALAKAMAHLSTALDHKDMDEMPAAFKGHVKTAHDLIEGVHDAGAKKNADGKPDSGFLPVIHEKALIKAVDHLDKAVDHDDVTPGLAKPLKMARAQVENVLDAHGSEKQATVVNKAPFSREKAMHIKSAGHALASVMHDGDAHEEVKGYAEKAVNCVKSLPGANFLGDDGRGPDYTDDSGNDMDASGSTGEGKSGPGAAAKAGRAVSAANAAILQEAHEHAKMVKMHKMATPYHKAAAGHAMKKMSGVLSDSGYGMPGNQDDADGDMGLNGSATGSAPAAERAAEALRLAAAEHAWSGTIGGLSAVRSAGGKAGDLLAGIEAARKRAEEDALVDAAIAELAGA